MKIFLTGDNHLGLKYASHEKSAELAEARISAFEGMVHSANGEGCELFVIAGDLFDNTSGIAKREIRRLFAMLSEFHGTVIVLPGNHDYYDDSVEVWQNVKSLLPEFHNILLLTEYRPYEMEVDDRKVILYPAFCTSKHSQPGENNLGWIRELNLTREDAVRIGIAHGAVEGETIDSEGSYFLMTREELEDIPVDVWLIGHTHVPFPGNLSDRELQNAGRILNAGTHVQTDVSCNTEGLCFVIEIGEDKTVKAKKVKTGNLRFYRKNLSVNGRGLKEALQAELAGIGPDSVVDLILSGALPEEEYEARDQIITDALAGFLEGSYNDYQVSRRISAETIDREFAETSFSHHFLTELLEEPKEAQLAYELLQTLKEEHHENR